MKIVDSRHRHGATKKKKGAYIAVSPFFIACFCGAMRGSLPTAMP